MMTEVQGKMVVDVMAGVMCVRRWCMRVGMVCVCGDGVCTRVCEGMVCVRGYYVCVEMVCVCGDGVCMSVCEEMVCTCGDGVCVCEEGMCVVTGMVWLSSRW